MLARRTHMTRSKALRHGTKRMRGGKKARANARANRILKKAAVKAGIETCEVRGPHCTVDNFLSWAHYKKRRHMTESDLETKAVLACWNCHWEVLEKGGEEKMTPLVEAIIEARETR